jgi:hypothetical protein
MCRHRQRAKGRTFAGLSYTESCGDAYSGVEAGTLAEQKPKQPAEVGAREIAEKFAQARGLNSQKFALYFAKLWTEGRVGTPFEVRGPQFRKDKPGTPIGANTS